MKKRARNTYPFIKKRTRNTFLYKLLTRQSVIYLEQITVVAGAHGIEP